MLLLDGVEGDLVVGAADVHAGAGALDGQRVVGAADVERLAVGAVDVGGRAERPVVDGVADLDLRAGRACGRRRGVGLLAFRAAAGQPEAMAAIAQQR